MNNVKKLLLIVFATFFLTQISNAQSTCDTIYINKLCRESKKAITNDLTKAQSLANEAVNLSKNCPNSNSYYLANISLANIYYQKENNDSIIDILLPIIKTFNGKLNNILYGKIYHKLSGAYIDIMKLEEGLKFSLLALKQQQETYTIL